MMSPSLTEEVVAAFKRRNRREDRRVARLSWAAFVSAGTKKRGGKWSVEDFMPQEPLSDEMRAKLAQAKLRVMQGRQKAAAKLKEKKRHG